MSLVIWTLNGFLKFFGGIFMSSLPDRLKDLRKANNITQVHMAKILECAEQHYQKIEYGKVNLTQDKLIKLAIFFEVSTDYLLGLTDNPKRN